MSQSALQVDEKHLEQLVPRLFPKGIVLLESSTSGTSFDLRQQNLESAERPKAFLAQTLRENTEKPLIVVRNAAELKESVHLTLFSKILTAIHLEQSKCVILSGEMDYAVRHISESEGSDPDLKNVLCFGLTLQDLQIQAQLQPDNSFCFRGYRFVLAPSLEKLADDVPAKKKLWAALKKYFSS
jgi:DNA polymerase III psi subunit